MIPAIFVGFLLNAALVARLGEVGRMFVLRRRVQKDEGVTLRMPTIAGTLVMEQIILGITLVAFVILMIVLLPNVPRQIIDGVIALTGAVVALVVGVIARGAARAVAVAGATPTRGRRPRPRRAGAASCAPSRPC